MRIFRRRPPEVSASSVAGGPIRPDRGREDWEKLYAYWLVKHVDGRPPAQADLDPVLEIPRLLPVLSLLNILPDGYQYRLAGTTVVEYFGCEMRGRRVGSLGNPTPLTQQWIGVLDQVTVDQKARLVISKFPRRIQTSHVTLVLPLVGADGRTERILAGTFFEKYAQTGVAPERLEAHEIVP